MTGCLEIVRIPNMRDWFQEGDRRNLVASVASGALVSWKKMAFLSFVLLICIALE